VRRKGKKFLTKPFNPLLSLRKVNYSCRISRRYLSILF